MIRTMFRAAQAALLLLAAFALPAAQAQIVIGSTFGATGPRASIGVPELNTMSVLPKTIAGQSVKYVVLDDGGDPTMTVKNIRKMTQEDKVDVVIGPSFPPTCLATEAIAAETKTVQLCVAPIPMRNPWVFSVPHPVPNMVEGVVENMKANKVKTVAFIGFADAWGEQNYAALMKLAPPAGIKVLTNERYDSTDTSVNAQILKVMSTHPDAVFIGASSTPAALPSIALVERGYKGRVYHTNGVLNPDFLRVGGKALEGIIAPAPLYVVIHQLPDSNPNKKVGLEYTKLYEAKFGAGSARYYGTLTYDAFLWLNAAIPVALKKGKPGTEEFRGALREALESIKDVVGVNSIYNLSADNHNGVDPRSRAMVSVENGVFKLLP